MGLIKIKNFNLDKPDELLCILTDESLTPVQKRMFDYFLWNAKQKVLNEKIKKVDNFLKVDVSLDELYAVIGFNRNRNQKIAYIIDKLRKLKRIDIIKINLIHEPMEFKASADFLSTLEDDEIEDIVLTSPIGQFKISNTQRVVTIYLSPIIVEYLINSNSYTKLNFLVYSFLRSTYSINLYNYLLNKFQSQLALMNKGIIQKSSEITTKKIEVERLMDILEVPMTHKARERGFAEFNEKILSKAIKELNKEDVVEFEIVKVLKEKKGKRVSKVAFVLKEKDRKKIPVLNKINNEILKLGYSDFEELSSLSIEEKEAQIIKDIEAVDSIEVQDMNFNGLELLKEKVINKNINFFSFVKELQKLQNVDITNMLPNHEGELLRINEFGLLELNGEELDNIKANSIRKILYSNPELLDKVEKVDEELLELKKRFLNKVLIFLQNNMYRALVPFDIERVGPNGVRLRGKELLEDKDYEIDVSVSWLKKQNTKNMLNLIDKDDFQKHNRTVMKDLLMEFYEKHKDEFIKWLEELEERSFSLNDELIKLEEGSDEFISLVKKIEKIDSFVVKGYEFVSGERIGEDILIKLLGEFKKSVLKNR